MCHVLKHTVVLGITGSEGYGIGFWCWGLVLHLLCLHTLRGIGSVSKELGCSLTFVSISDKGLKMSLAGNCPGSCGTPGYLSAPCALCVLCDGHSL